MSDVLKKYSIVIGADTKELMAELNKAERELVQKLNNKDLGSGVRSSIEKLVEKVATMRSELRTATKDINNSITAISTDSLKNEFNGLQEIISKDIHGLETKIEGLQKTIDVLNNTGGLKNLESGLTETFSNIELKMNNIMEEFKTFHDFIQDVRIGAIDTSKLDQNLKVSEQILKKTTKSMKRQFDSLLQSYDSAKISNILTVGVDKNNIKEAENFLNVMMSVRDQMNKMDSESAQSVLNDNALNINTNLLDKQIKILYEDVNEFYNKIRNEVKGKTPDVYLRWKTEINPDETAQDIINKIDTKYTEKVQKHLDEKPLKFKTAIDNSDFEKVIRDAIKEENKILKDANAPKIKIGLGIDKLDKSNIQEIANDISGKVDEIRAGNLNISGGNLDLSSENLAQESTLSDIKEILSTWNGSGIPGTQSKEQIKQNQKTESNLKNAGYLLHGKLRGNISQENIDTAKLREQLINEQEWLYGQLEEMKKLRRIGMKRITKNPDLLKQSELYNSYVEVDGIKYAKWGNNSITLADWQAQLDEIVQNGINDYFQNAINSIEKQIKTKKENLSLLGVEFNQDGKILARNTVAIGENEIYKAAYSRVSSLRNQTLDNGLQEEKNKLELLKQQRTLMQQIVELSTKQSFTGSNKEEEKLTSLKEQLRVITQICSDEGKFNALLKEETELQDKMNSGKLDSKGFNRLMEIRQEMSTMWTDASDDMVAFSKQCLSSTDTQLSQIDNDIAQQQLKVNKMVSVFRKEFSQIQRETFGKEIKNDYDYEKKLNEWKIQSEELAVLQNSITKVDEKGKVSYDMSALLDSEKERYWHLNNSVSKLGEQLHTYRELNNIQADVIGEEKKENEVLNSKNRNLSETQKIINSIYRDSSLSESKNLSLMSVEELQRLSSSLGNVINSNSVDVDEQLEQKAHSYIDRRIEYLESQLSYANTKIKLLNEKSGDTSYWENKRHNIQNDLAALKATQNQSRTEKDILEDIKTQNKLDNESLTTIKAILDLTVEIEKSKKRVNELDKVINSESKTNKDLDIKKRKANQEKIEETDSLKLLHSARQQLFGKLPYTGKSNDIISSISNLLKNGLDGVSDSLITEFVNKKLKNAFVQNTINNVKSTENTRQTEMQMAINTKKRVDAVILEKLEQKQITEEKRKQAELDVKIAQKNENRSVTTKNREINKKYNDKITNLETLISEQSKTLDEANSNLQKAKETQEKANNNLKKYESFNAYESEINSNRELINFKQEQLDAEKNYVNDLKDRIQRLTKVLNDKSFTNGQTEESVKTALERAKFELQERELKLVELETKTTEQIDSANKEIEKLIEKRSKSRSRYAKNNVIDTNISLSNINSLFESYGKDSFNSKKYIDEVLKYMTYGGDYSNLPEKTASIISNYINSVKTQNAKAVSQAQSIYDTARNELQQSKDTLDNINKSKEAEKEAIKLYEAEKKYVEILEQQFSLANTSKSKRLEKSDLFSYANKNSVFKGMTDEQKMSSFKVDYQLDSITKLLTEQEKIRISAGETSNEYLEITKQIDLAKSRLEIFRNEAVELGLTISQNTGRAILDSSKESTVLYKDMFTGVSESYIRTVEQEKQFRTERKNREEEEKQALKEQEELQSRITAAKLGTAKAEGSITSEQNKTTDKSKFYQSMTNEEAKLAEKLFKENGKLFNMRKKNSNYSQEEIANQKDIVKQLERQVEQSERLELYKSKGNVSNARLRSEYKGNSVSSTPSTSDLPATENTLVEIKNILSNKLGVKSTSQTSEKQSTKESKGIFNTKGYQEVAKSLGLLQKNKDGNYFVNKKDRNKVYAEMDKLGIAKFIEEDTKATKDNTKSKLESKKAIDKDTSSTKENTSEKSKQTKKTKVTTSSTFDEELYKKIAKENNWLTKRGTVQKDKRDNVYLEMEKQKSGSSGKTKEQLEEIRKKLKETTVAQKELNAEQSKDTSSTFKKETQEVKRQTEAVKENTNAQTKNNEEKTKSNLKSNKSNISSGNGIVKELENVSTKEDEVIAKTQVMYRAFNSSNGISGKGISWFSDELETAESYIESRGKDRIARLVTDTSKFLTIDASGSSFNKILYGGIERTTDELAEMAKQAGYAGIAINNVYDSFSASTDIKPSSIFAIFDENIVKKATDVTETIKVKESVININSLISETNKKLELEKANQKELNALLDDYNNGRKISAEDKDYIEDGTLQKSLESSIKVSEAYERKLESLNVELAKLYANQTSATSIEDVFQNDFNSSSAISQKYSKETLQKFIEGAKAETPEMQKAFSELAKIPEETIRQALQINSPSEVMKKLGFWAIEGLAVGITENADKVRVALEEAVKNGTVSIDELNELSGYSKTRQRNSSYKNIYQGIKNLDVETLLRNQVDESQQLIQKIIETSNKAMSESGLSSMFFVDGKKKSQNDVAKYIRENTEEVRIALEEYIRIFAESGLDANKTIDDVFADIFGDKHKTVSNAYSAAISKKANNTSNDAGGDLDKFKKEINKTYFDYEKKLEKLNKISLSIENGNVTNKNLQERAKLIQEISGLEKKINEYQKQGISNEQAGFDIAQKKCELDNKKAQYENNLLTTKLSSLDVKLRNLQESPSQNQAFSQIVNQASESLSTLHKLLDKPFLNEEESIKAKDLFSSIRNIINELNSLNGKEVTSFIDQKSVKQYLESMQGIRNESIKIYNNGNKISGVVKETNGVSRTLEYTWNNILGCFVKSNEKLTNHVSLWSALKGQVSKSWKYLRSYFSGYMLATRVISTIRKGINYVRELDTALTEMRKVSDECVSSLKKYQATTFDTANEIGSTAVQIQDSTADWMRLGESIDEAAESAKASNILLNVSEFDSIDAATESLIAMSSAYKDLEKMDIIDVMNKIGNEYSISTDGIATALQDSASSLVTANNDLYEATALITAGNAVTQDPSKVGSGMRTIALRLTGTEAAKEDLAELGEDTDTMITSVSKLQKTIKQATAAATSDGKGFDILDANGNYKSTYEIMQGLADLYDEIVAKDKELGTNNLNLLIETIAGKNRSNIAASILQNGDMLESVFNDAQKAEGSALVENAKYIDSIDGKMQQLSNKAQEFWFELIDSEFIKTCIDLLTELLDFLTQIVDKAGLLGTIGLGTGLFAGIKNVGRLKMQSLIVLNCRQ